MEGQVAVEKTSSAAVSVGMNDQNLDRGNTTQPPEIEARVDESLIVTITAETNNQTITRSSIPPGKGAIGGAVHDLIKTRSTVRWNLPNLESKFEAAITYKFDLILNLSAESSFLI